DDVDDVRVTDVVDRLGLVEEPGGNVLVARELRVQDLEGDLLADRWVLRQVDCTHTSLAQLLGHQVVADGLTNEKVWLRGPLLGVHEFSASHYFSLPRRESRGVRPAVSAFPACDPWCFGPSWAYLQPISPGLMTFPTSNPGRPLSWTQ